MSARMRTAFLATLVLVACGGPEIRGPGTLLDGRPLTTSVGRPVEVRFDVELFCGPAGPMRSISSVAAEVTGPDGGVSPATARVDVHERTTYDCTPTEFKSMASVVVPLTPIDPGLHTVRVTFEPAVVGTFSRQVVVAP